MYYVANINVGPNGLDIIMREIELRGLIIYIHTNGASLEKVYLQTDRQTDKEQKKIVPKDIRLIN